MTAHAVTRHEIFQTSLISALVQGVYEDEMTLAELLGHGSFGIGTFNGLDGEMIILGGVCYRLRGMRREIAGGFNLTDRKSVV